MIVYSAPSEAFQYYQKLILRLNFLIVSKFLKTYIYADLKFIHYNWTWMKKNSDHNLLFLYELHNRPWPPGFPSFKRSWPNQTITLNITLTLADEYPFKATGRFWIFNFYDLNNVKSCLIDNREWTLLSKIKSTAPVENKIIIQPNPVQKWLRLSFQFPRTFFLFLYFFFWACLFSFFVKSIVQQPY